MILPDESNLYEPVFPVVPPATLAPTVVGMVDVDELVFRLALVPGTGYRVSMLFLSELFLAACKLFCALITPLMTAAQNESSLILVPSLMAVDAEEVFLRFRAAIAAGRSGWLRICFLV